jgi:putative addiction module killer protein
MLEVRRYVTASGKDVIGEWLADLRDAQARARIAARIARLAAGNFGDCKPIDAGVSELRIDWGPGYRLYYAVVGRRCILLLCGGDNRKQSADIKRAVRHLRDYKQRTEKP